MKIILRVRLFQSIILYRRAKYI